ncbi:hypothetical protein EC973_002870 [Apophysomyces ossiformis]|uniref:Uncharacterized protein n=1 Tax=Apophysomyces ossiformis TaxID=679940 RepID=A0A8H7BME1_9FUNG|nr:hypothetical protein EC973_002870 [Apophysomyces ossiformis]
MTVNDTSNRFSVEYRDYYKVLTNHITNEKYALVYCNKTLADTAGYHAVVNVPVQRVSVANALDILPFMELLGLQDKVTFIQDPKQVTSPCYNVTDTIASHIDVVFTNKSNTDSGTSPAYVSFSASDDSLSPLEKASWLVYVAFFFNQEGRAFVYFNDIMNNYLCHKNNLANAPSQTYVAWTKYDAPTKTWKLLRDPYYQQLMADAGVAKLLQPNSAQSADFTNLFEFHVQMQHAESVIDLTPMEYLGDKEPYLQWLTLGGFNNDTDNYMEPFKEKKRVFRMDGLTNANGYPDWPERSPVRPDLALLDMIHLFYPDYNKDYQFTWVRNFAMLSDPRQINPSTYLACANPLAALNQANCVINDQFKPPNSPTQLSEGDKAGVSVGTIVFFFLVLGAGIFLFRRYRRRTRHRFYQMDNNAESWTEMDVSKASQRTPHAI